MNLRFLYFVVFVLFLAGSCKGNAIEQKFKIEPLIYDANGEIVKRTLEVSISGHS
jgi:hypothetical protein